LVGKFVLGYSGNLGRAHDFATVLAAAERLRADTNIIFLMIGGGKGFGELSAAVKARGLDRSFRFVPYQERQLLPYSLGVADVHWISLNPRLEGLIVPSKFYGIAAAGKPIIVIGDKAEEIAQLVQQHGCGIVITLGDADTLAETLQKLSTALETISAMGMRARAMLDAHFDSAQST
jgi:colanic acid biosynthesis glycosyl transferase WcaI